MAEKPRKKTARTSATATPGGDAGRSDGTHYLVTGATGFIGRFLVERLAQRAAAKIHVLVRETSADKFEALQARLGEAGEKLIPLYGDITEPAVIAAADLRRLKGKIEHVFHLAAAYDMNMSDATADRVNAAGTRNVVGLVNALGGARQKTIRLHHISSVAVAGGDFVGRFTEDMFDENQRLSHPYYRTKFEAEKIVREESRVPFRIYRPGAVVGSSQTGEIDKIDGPYYFFKTIQKISDRMPKWMPLFGIEGGRVPIAPVDYVAAAIDALAHKPGLDGQCFHLMQSHSPTVGELLETFLEVAHGPGFARKLQLSSLPSAPKKLAGALGGRVPAAAQRRLSRAIGVPLSVLGYVSNRAVFDDRQARTALKGTGIACPDVRDYADRLWRYWELHLDVGTRVPARLVRAVAGKVVVVTGASSGIGFTTAKKLAAAGAKIVLVARTREKLEEAQKIIATAGGEAHVHPCDLTNLADIDRCAAEVLREFGHIDVLVNNAGRSIRRGVLESLTRFHDFERTMQLNYFGAVRLILALLPSMVQRKSGHIINISSIGVLANAPRFAAYVASKAALDAFSRCLSAEIKHKNIHFTAIYMPLVRTPMIAPTKIYQYVPTWSPDNAADTVIRAIVEKPKSIATPLGTAAAVSYAIWPKVNDYILSKGFRLFPSSGPTRGRKEAAPKPTLEQVVFANVFKGEHW
ncbi:MAG: SDR family oxidoreductase [Gammaproteobacteria bacterium]|nr:SDR family oxidoreductase [Gammaproteobacteria bacterium]